MDRTDRLILAGSVMSVVAVGTSRGPYKQTLCGKAGGHAKGVVTLE